MIQCKYTILDDIFDITSNPHRLDSLDIGPYYFIAKNKYNLYKFEDSDFRSLMPNHPLHQENLIEVVLFLFISDHIRSYELHAIRLYINLESKNIACYSEHFLKHALLVRYLDDILKPITKNNVGFFNSYKFNTSDQQCLTFPLIPGEKMHRGIFNKVSNILVINIPSSLINKIDIEIDPIDSITVDFKYNDTTSLVKYHYDEIDEFINDLSESDINFTLKCETLEKLDKYNKEVQNE